MRYTKPIKFQVKGMSMEEGFKYKAVARKILGNHIAVRGWNHLYHKWTSQLPDGVVITSIAPGKNIPPLITVTSPSYTEEEGEEEETTIYPRGIICIPVDVSGNFWGPDGDGSAWSGVNTYPSFIKFSMDETGSVLGLTRGFSGHDWLVNLPVRRDQYVSTPVDWRDPDSGDIVWYMSGHNRYWCKGETSYLFFKGKAVAAVTEGKIIGAMVRGGSLFALSVDDDNVYLSSAPLDLDGLTSLSISATFPHPTGDFPEWGSPPVPSEFTVYPCSVAADNPQAGVFAYSVTTRDWGDVIGNVKVSTSGTIEENFREEFEVVETSKSFFASMMGEVYQPWAGADGHYYRHYSGWAKWVTNWEPYSFTQEDVFAIDFKRSGGGYSEVTATLTTSVNRSSSVYTRYRGSYNSQYNYYEPAVPDYSTILKGEFNAAVSDYASSPYGNLPSMNYGETSSVEGVTSITGNYLITTKITLPNIGEVEIEMASGGEGSGVTQNLSRILIMDMRSDTFIVEKSEASCYCFFENSPPPPTSPWFTKHPDDSRVMVDNTESLAYEHQDSDRDYFDATMQVLSYKQGGTTELLGGGEEGEPIYEKIEGELLDSPPPFNVGYKMNSYSSAPVLSGDIPATGAKKRSGIYSEIFIDNLTQGGSVMNLMYGINDHDGNSFVQFVTGGDEKQYYNYLSDSQFGYHRPWEKCSRSVRIETTPTWNPGEGMLTFYSPFSQRFDSVIGIPEENVSYTYRALI